MTEDTDYETRQRIADQEYRDQRGLSGAAAAQWHQLRGHHRRAATEPGPHRQRMGDQREQSRRREHRLRQLHQHRALGTRRTDSLDCRQPRHKRDGRLGFSLRAHSRDAAVWRMGDSARAGDQRRHGGSLSSRAAVGRFRLRSHCQRTAPKPIP